MFNPHIHQQQQQQQQQQFHQHLRQLQQLFQQQQPPPPPPPQPPPGHHVAHHHHQTPRAIPVPPQTAPPPRMVNLCQATQTTIIAPNPMLQGALLMQQMQGNMRSFGMGAQQFRQFFAASARSSLLGPVPMGMAIKSPMMGFPGARPFHPHTRYYNNNAAAVASTTTASSSYASPSTTTDAAARQPDRKRDSEQMALGSADDQPAASSTNEATDKAGADGVVGGAGGPTELSEDQLEEPALKKQRTERSEEPKETAVVENITLTGADDDVLFSECNRNTQDSQPDDLILLEEGGSTGGSDAVEALEESRAAEVHGCSPAPSPSAKLNEDDQQVNLQPEEMTQDKGDPLALPDIQEEGDEGVSDGANKFYCYLCSITCHNQQNFRSHMNSVSHQQRMMEIQHMSNACLVTLLPRVQESLQGVIKDGEKKEKEDTRRWCATCHTHFTSSLTEHRRTEEHRLASRTAISSCTVCKKHFRTSQIFVEHLQSLEHRQKLEKLQEMEGSEALGKLTAMDTDGFALEEVESDEVGEGEETQRSEGEKEEHSEKQDGWSSLKEVTLKDMTGDEQHDPDTVYGSSFFVPVAGFICRLCNKFYHFESSALHTHCKSLKHFEKLKRYREMLSQTGEAAASSRESPQAADGLRPTTDTSTDCLDENPLFDDTGLVTDTSSTEPLDQLNMKAENEEQGEQVEPEPTSQDSVAQEGSAELSADSKEEPDSEAGTAAEDANEEEKETEAPAVSGKRSGTGKEKTQPKRRSGRAANRR